MNKPVILDCDPGIDDAAAIAILASADTYDLKAITTCAGNQLSEKTYTNARNLLYLMGREDIPVYKGSEKPLYRNLMIADDIHGDSGLGTVQLEESPAPHTGKTAIECLARLIEKSENMVTIIATGPLTNIGIFITAYPKLKLNIEKIILMGGAYHGGNCTPCAEFNIAVDPEAAKLVFESEIPIYMFGLDATRKAQFYTDDIERLNLIGNKTGAALAIMLSFNGIKSPQSVLDQAKNVECVYMHDPCTAAYLIKPELFTFSHVNVVVETAGEYTSGCTVVDYLKTTGRKENTYVAFGVNRKGFADLVCDCVSQLK